MFDHLVGNIHLKSALGRLIARGRLPHSLILAGDDGVGKRAFGVELARSLVCTDASDEACGVCSACTRAGVFNLPKDDDKAGHERVIRSNHPDVATVIPYNRNILVKAIRDLEAEANFLPYEARRRVFIIDNADRMNEASSNALLKTLEEPPATTYIFLITSRPDALLLTIRSRCQLLRFAPVATDEIVGHLIEQKAFTSDEARFAAGISRGSIGRALKVDVGRTRDIREKLLSAVANALTVGNRARLLQAAEEINASKRREDFEDSLDLLQSLIHDVWKLNVGGDHVDVVNAEVRERMVQLARAAGSADLPSWLSAIDKVRDDLAVNINRKIAADALFVGMAGEV